MDDISPDMFIPTFDTDMSFVVDMVGINQGMIIPRFDTDDINQGMFIPMVDTDDINQGVIIPSLRLTRMI
jgi:hypothetical protein